MKDKLIVVSAPSGAGKTTIVKHLLEIHDDFAFSVSATTRPKRNNEIEGKDYYFISLETFKELIAKNAFVEWEEVYDNQFYGTLKSEIERIWALDKYIIFDIDVKGALNIKKIYGDQVMCIFVKPPNWDILLKRLRDRKTEDLASLEKRINKAKFELTFEDKFDYILINDQLEVAFKEAELAVNDFLKN